MIVNMLTTEREDRCTRCVMQGQALYWHDTCFEGYNVRGEMRSKHVICVKCVVYV
jgi:hypothetical protein